MEGRAALACVVFHLPSEERLQPAVDDADVEDEDHRALLHARQDLQQRAHEGDDPLVDAGLPREEVAEHLGEEDLGAVKDAGVVGRGAVLVGTLGGAAGDDLGPHAHGDRGRMAIEDALGSKVQPRIVGSQEGPCDACMATKLPASRGVVRDEKGRSLDEGVCRGAKGREEAGRKTRDRAHKEVARCSPRTPTHPLDSCAASRSMQKEKGKYRPRARSPERGFVMQLEEEGRLAPSVVWEGRTPTPSSL